VHSTSPNPAESRGQGGQGSVERVEHGQALLVGELGRDSTPLSWGLLW
jgi:hypothetical protein